MKALILFISLVLSGHLNAQSEYDGVLAFGHIYHNGTTKAVKGAFVTLSFGDIFQERIEADNKGEFEVRIPYDQIATLTFQAEGFVSKIVEIDARNIPLAERAGGFAADIDLFLFKPVGGCDLGIFAKPIGKAKYDAKINGIYYDKEYQNQLKEELKKVLSCLEKAQ